ncbi:MAG: DNA-directed RNA polymerase subunit alpha [Planctomycetes bacterium]|nr:DNA-directed RNA polymerase subunit alpha [Planctomycetota bacterium]
MVATLDAIEDQIRTGRVDQADKALEQTTETDENRLELSFLRAYLKEARYDREGALDAYRDVLEEAPDHIPAAFRAAGLCDLGGDDTAAMELYERCLAGESVPINAMLNLSLLYEEHHRLQDAENLLEYVLSEHPNHTRAREILKSVRSSYTMVYDERDAREQEQWDAVLDVPVTDFELSVRSRNCLRQMDITTLGDLLKTTETQLLSYKNFGETSLNEIRAMLSQKGLRLGQEPDLVQPVESAVAPTDVAAEESGANNTPVSSLELSVRSRKCLQRLGVATLGELTQHSELELTATKNFGETSLDEIKRQLGLHGLTFRTTP